MSIHNKNFSKPIRKERKVSADIGYYLGWVLSCLKYRILKKISLQKLILRRFKLTVINTDNRFIFFISNLITSLCLHFDNSLSSIFYALIKAVSSGCRNVTRNIANKNCYSYFLFLPNSLCCNFHVTLFPKGQIKILHFYFFQRSTVYTT